jgi:polysaccharide export outer membrane protein
MAVAVAAGVLSAQQPVPPQPPPATAAPAQPAPPANTDQAKPAVPEGVTPPPDYVIGAEDVLSIVVWREKELSAEVTVRPDGKVTLPLLNDVDAAGLTPEQLRQQLTTAATRYVADPIVTVLVRAINSRKVYITGEVRNPGIYPLVAPTTVLQLIARAGGTNENANTK